MLNNTLTKNSNFNMRQIEDLYNNFEKRNSKTSKNISNKEGKQFDK